MIDKFQKTLSRAVKFKGVGLHSGKKSAMSSARDFSTPKNATVGAECASIPPRQPVPSHF